MCLACANDFLMHFSMVVTRGSGSSDPKRPSASDDEILRISVVEVSTEIRGYPKDVWVY